MTVQVLEGESATHSHYNVLVRHLKQYKIDNQDNKVYPRHTFFR